MELLKETRKKLLEIQEDTFFFFFTNSLEDEGSSNTLNLVMSIIIFF